MRLIMAGKLRKGARDVGPFGKSAAPCLLVLGNDMKLRKIIGDELHARTRRIEVERGSFRFVFEIAVAAFAPLEQLAIFRRDQSVRLGCRVAHRKTARCLTNRRRYGRASASRTVVTSRRRRGWRENISLSRLVAPHEVLASMSNRRFSSSLHFERS